MHLIRKSRVSRRAFLGGLSAGAALSPFLPWLDAHGQSAAPRRLVIFHSPNGITKLFERWRPTGTETNFTAPLNDQLGPLLAANKQNCIVVDGVGNAAGTQGGHSAAPPEMLTGWRSVRPGDKPSTRAAGISVDQHIANKVGGQTRFKSLQLGVQVTENNSNGLGGACIVYTGPSQPVLPENSPIAAFNRLFAGVSGRATGTEPTVDSRIAHRKSVLDLVTSDLNEVRTLVGSDDRIKIERHLEGIRELERSLTGLAGPPTPAGAVCDRPALSEDTSIPGLLKAHIDLIAATLACDLTRVITLQLGYSIWNPTFAWLPGPGKSRGHHSLNHNQVYEGTIEVNNWTAKQFSYLIDKLKMLNEGETSALDNSALMWINEFGDGDAHSNAYIPVVLAGRAGGAWKTGRYLRYPARTPHNNLLLSLCHAMGVNDAAFGNPQVCKGPLVGL